MNPKISVVIPMLNETSNLEPLLEALMNQTYQPDDIIFVDAGSTDGSPLLVVDWWKSNGSKAGACHVISRQGAFPGGARNFGIRTASSDWIAFLDCGIVPDENWLAALVQCADDGKAKAVFGVCRFVPKEDRMSQALCALSYGEGKLWNVLPASIVHRSVFESIGGFREELRSAEDIEWFKRFERRYGPRFTCKQAIVTYSNFPATLRKAVVKWFVYARNTVRAGVWIRHQLIVCAVWFMVIGVSFINWGTALVVLFAYTATRGVLTPLYRNGVRQVLGRPSTLLLTYLVGFVLDLAKLSGFLTEYLYKLKEIFFSSKGSRHHPSSV